jgi:molybdenum cofactor cytidylyltransferase
VIGAGQICGVLLAAGRSQRFGVEDKLLAEINGDPLILHVAQRLSELGLGRLLAVCNDAEGRVAQLLGAIGFEVVLNPHPEQGLSRSLACGIAEAARGSEAAAMVCLADMPFVSVDHLRALLARFDAAGNPVVASARGDVAMPPAIFARSLFEWLQAGEGDHGARELLAAAARVRANANELTDIDRPSDLSP